MKSHTLKAITNHIEANIKIYFVMLVFYLFSLVCGAFCVTFLSLKDLDSLKVFFESFLNIYKSSGVEFWTLYQTIFLDNLKYLFIIFIGGFIVVGMPFVVAIFCAKVFYIGFAFGTVLKVYGLSGVLIALGNVFFQNFLTLPLMFVFTVISVKFSFNLLRSIKRKNRVKNNVPFEKGAASFVFQFVLFAIILAVFNTAETFLTLLIS